MLKRLHFILVIIAAAFYLAGGMRSCRNTHQADENISVRFQGFQDRGFGPHAIVRVTNNSDQTAYFQGYEKRDHCGGWVRYPFTMKKLRDCWCGVGLEEQTLEPGETITYEEEIVDQRMSFRIGYEFTTGKTKVLKTIWTERVER